MLYRNGFWFYLISFNVRRTKHPKATSCLPLGEGGPLAVDEVVPLGKGDRLRWMRLSPHREEGQNALSSRLYCRCTPQASLREGGGPSQTVEGVSESSHLQEHLRGAIVALLPSCFASHLPLGGRLNGSERKLSFVGTSKGCYRCTPTVSFACETA